MNLRNLFISVGIILFFSSCLKERSNYNYKDGEIISVKGLEKTYTKVSEVEKLILSPEVTSTDPDANFEYLWGIYETMSPIGGKLDTIGRTKNLDYLVKQDARSWRLLFRVTNKHTNYSQYFTSDLNVVTPFTMGWYVAKDDGDSSDLDLFLTPNSIAPEGSVENIFSQVNGRKLEGKAKLLNFYTSYKSNVTGSFANTRALFILSDKDASVVNINTLREIRNLHNLFFEAPVNAAPDLVSLGSAALYFVNDGKCHSIYSYGANTGQFGVAKMRDNFNTPYHLSKYFIPGWIIGDPCFFDEASSSFVTATGTGATMVAVKNGANSDMSANNNNKKLLFMGLKVVYPQMGYAVFQDKTDPALKILSQVKPSNSSFIIKNDTLKTTDHLYNATDYAVLDGDENIMYFVEGNQVWSRNLSNKYEQLQFTADAGEEITFLRHRKYNWDANYGYNYVMVGTKSGDKYKVRMFKKSSGNLEDSPSVVLEGKGEVKDVIFIAPPVNENTYSNTY